MNDYHQNFVTNIKRCIYDTVIIYDKWDGWISMSVYSQFTANFRLEKMSHLYLNFSQAFQQLLQILSLIRFTHFMNLYAFYVFLFLGVYILAGNNCGF